MCNVVRVLPTLEVDKWIKVIYMEDIGLINNASNPILAHEVHPPSTSSTTHFEGPSLRLLRG